MHRLKVLILACLAVFMLGAVASAVASAAEKELPRFTVPTAGTGESKKGELAVEGSSIKCEKATNSFGAGEKLGTFTIRFLECKGPATVGKCWSLGDPKGEILVGGEWHLVQGEKIENKRPLIWLLFASADNSEAIHLECEKVLILTLIWGNLLLTITPAEKETEKFSLVVEREKEEQKLRAYFNNEGKEVTAEGLKASVDGGTARSAGEQSLENSLTTTSKTEIKG